MFKLVITRDRVSKEETASIMGKLKSFQFGDTLGDLKGIFTFQSGFSSEVSEFPQTLVDTMKSMGLAAISNATVDLTNETVSLDT